MNVRRSEGIRQIVLDDVETREPGESKMPTSVFDKAKVTKGDGNIIYMVGKNLRLSYQAETFLSKSNLRNRLSFPERSEGNEVAKIEIQTWRRKDFCRSGDAPTRGGV